MASNVGNQTVNVKYFDSIINAKVNAIGMSVRKTGIYSGGHLTKTNDTTVALSTPLAVEILDSAGAAFEQVYVVASGYTTVGTSIPITVSAVNNLIILTWTYTGDAATDYLSFQAVPAANIASYPNALVVGLANSANGAGWSGFDYTLRSNPNIFDYHLKVEPPEATDPSQMQVRIRGGRVNYGTASYQIVDQMSPTLVAPGSGSYIGLIQINSVGVVVTPTYGSISGGTPTPPSYSGLVTLAEITLVSGQTSIVAANIKDVRSFIAAATPPNTYVDRTTDQSIAGVKTFTSGLVIPAVTSDGTPVNGQIWLRSDL